MKQSALVLLVAACLALAACTRAATSAPRSL